MARTVQRSTLGAWLLKANPAVWDVRGLLDSGEGQVTSWSVRTGYRSALMTAGDPVLFWVSGNGRDGLVRGVWGLGTVTAPAEPWTEEQAGRWRTPDGPASVQARVEVDIRLLDEPVEHTELRAFGIDDLEVQRQPFAANPSWVSREQLDRLRPLLPPWPAAGGGPDR